MDQAHPTYHLVIGLGASGMSMARFLKHIGKHVVATDLDASKTKEAKELEDLGIETQIGFHDQETFNRADTLVPSPGIPISSPNIRAAMDAGVRLSGELDIFSEHNTLPVIAITGTNGKTTTTTLVGDILKTAGRQPFVCGNIGTPLVDLITVNRPADIVVAEVSSFQLDLAVKFRPDIGVLLNISADHLDRYADYAAYEKSKWSLFERQGENDTAIVNAAIATFNAYRPNIKSKMHCFSSSTDTPVRCNAMIRRDDLEINLRGEKHCIKADLMTGLRGTHNLENAAAAVLACLAAGIDITGIEAGLKSFRPLSHRMENIGTIHGVSFFNDSKATNTDAVIRAIECFDTGIVLILGGRVKGTDFSLLAPSVQKNVKTIVAIGESRKEIEKALSPVCRVVMAADMQDAVEKSFKAAKENDIVLLSPACASFDMYENYAHRGRDFLKQVNRLKDL